jgi:hypothetical protein
MRFEDEGELDDEDDLVADFGVRLRRAQSSRSVERYAALCLCAEIPSFAFQGVWQERKRKWISN